MSEAKVFYELLNKYDKYFKKADVILELGGGQSWASCIVKKIYKDKHIYASDLTKYAVDSAFKWENIFNVKLDGKFECKSYELPFEDNSVDLIFCFQAAHHFIKHKSTLNEIYRVLKKGGVCIYFHEPSCNKLLYKLAYKRVNKNRPEVYEDVLIYSELKKIALNLGFKFKHIFYPSIINRKAIPMLYYTLLNKFEFFQKILSCTFNFIFKK